MMSAVSRGLRVDQRKRHTCLVGWGGEEWGWVGLGTGGLGSVGCGEVEEEE